MNNFKSSQKNILKENSKEQNMERVRMSNEKRLEDMSNETRKDCDIDFHNSVTPLGKNVDELKNTYHDIKDDVDKFDFDDIPRIQKKHHFISEENKKLKGEVQQIHNDVKNVINENIHKIEKSYEYSKDHEMNIFCQKAHDILTEFSDERYIWMKKVEETRIVSAIVASTTVAIVFFLFYIIQWVENYMKTNQQ